MSFLVLKCIILIIICANAADESAFRGKKTKNPPLNSGEIVKFKTAVLCCIDDSESFWMTLTSNCLTLIAYCRCMQKLKRAILESYKTNMQTGEFFLY